MDGKIMNNYYHGVEKTRKNSNFPKEYNSWTKVLVVAQR